METVDFKHNNPLIEDIGVDPVFLAKLWDGDIVFQVLP